MAPCVGMATTVECDHCGYNNKYEADRLKGDGAEGAWCCPACSLCNTTYHKPDGFVTVLGYQRDLEVGVL